MNPAAAMAWYARSTIWRAEGKKRSDINWAALRQQYDHCEQRMPDDEQEIVLDRARATMDAIAHHPTWTAEDRRRLLEDLKEYADDLLFNVR